MVFLQITSVKVGCSVNVVQLLYAGMGKSSWLCTYRIIPNTENMSESGPWSEMALQTSCSTTQEVCGLFRHALYIFSCQD